MKSPWTAQPCSLSNRAVTAESTPPDSPTTIGVADLAGVLIRPPRGWRVRSADPDGPPNPVAGACRRDSPLCSASPGGCEGAAGASVDQLETASECARFH